MDVCLSPWKQIDESHMVTKRLREHFPDMIIIVINHVFPMGMRLKGAWGGKEDLLIDPWAKYEGMQQTDADFFEKVRSIAQEKSGTWDNFYAEYYDERFIDQYMADMQSQLLANTYFLNFYHGMKEGLDYWEKFAGMTCESDYHHPCHVGHEKYAAAIQKIIAWSLRAQNKNPYSM